MSVNSLPSPSTAMSDCGVGFVATGSGGDQEKCSDFPLAMSSSDIPIIERIECSASGYATGSP